MLFVISHSGCHPSPYQHLLEASICSSKSEPRHMHGNSWEGLPIFSASLEGGNARARLRLHSPPSIHDLGHAGSHLIGIQQTRNPLLAVIFSRSLWLLGVAIVWPPSETKHSLPFSTVLLIFIPGMNVFTILLLCHIIEGKWGWYIVMLNHTRVRLVVVKFAPQADSVLFSSCLKANTLPSHTVVQSCVSVVGERSRCPRICMHRKDRLLPPQTRDTSREQG